MNLEAFVKKHEFLYHLTSQENSRRIIESGIFHSTTSLVGQSDLDTAQGRIFLSERRVDHMNLTIEGEQVMIRDQRPISILAMSKSLINCTPGDFLNHLNSRVFFWPNLNRLNRHYERYQDENPVIFRVSTESFLRTNNNPLFCHLNSGATRCSSYHNGAPPPRGLNTFVPADKFGHIPSKVAEVTFENSCDLPENYSTASRPDGPWN